MRYKLLRSKKPKLKKSKAPKRLRSKRSYSRLRSPKRLSVAKHSSVSRSGRVRRGKTTLSGIRKAKAKKFKVAKKRAPINPLRRSIAAKEGWHRRRRRKFRYIKHKGR